jgi:hypothetical protein
MLPILCGRPPPQPESLRFILVGAAIVLPTLFAFSAYFTLGVPR